MKNIFRTITLAGTIIIGISTANASDDWNRDSTSDPDRTSQEFVAESIIHPITREIVTGEDEGNVVRWINDGMEGSCPMPQSEKK